MSDDLKIDPAAIYDVDLEMHRQVEMMDRITKLGDQDLLIFYGETFAASILLKEQNKIPSSQMAFADAQVAFNEILKRMKND